MDAHRFDSLARALGAPSTRRRALGALAAGGLFGGLGRAAPAIAARDGVCTLDFVATVRQGPGAGQTQNANQTAPGDVRGTLSFSLTETGALKGGALRRSDGASLPVVGQAVGVSLQMRITFPDGTAMVAVGVGEQPIADCRGALSGLATGPTAGDLGDWRASAQGTTAAPAVTRQGDTQPKDAQPKEKPPKEKPPKDKKPDAQPTAIPTPTPTPEAAVCAAGLTRCGAACVDLATDLANCGACDAVCESGLVAVACRGGECVRADCPPDQAYCGAVDGCRDLARDPAHCGACGAPCAANQECAAGVCRDVTVACLDGQTRCGDECVDVFSNDFNCGECGNVCSDLGASMFCEGGFCREPGCPAGTTDCGGYCADLATSADNCGGCGIPCAAGEWCNAGVCVSGAAQCEPGMTNCHGVCVDLTANAEHCGVCDFACGAGEWCDGGMCAAAEFACGGPGDVCATNDECCSGVCDGGVCAAPQFACGGPGDACASDDECCSGACFMDAAGGGSCF
ncbi:MAG: hypothetical protein IT337_07330 [Thermomicrobiales bacterium]|nr:hypothetical protein [Thermomicrobiales bacterium]